MTRMNDSSVAYTKTFDSSINKTVLTDLNYSSVAYTKNTCTKKYQNYTRDE